ncbi:MAG TPA: hypothetical protein VJP77_06085 [Planctomycetota bacterium]|nr:hypothetical protein [Planctomycetota bacterium]
MQPNRLKAFLATCAAACGALAGPAAAQEIDILLSVKFVNDANGNRPPGAWSSEANLVALVDDMNTVLDRLGRGYRYVLAETLDVCSTPGSPVCGASAGFFDLGPEEFKDLELAAEAAPSVYHWRTWATNVYVVNSAHEGGGLAPIASNPSDAGYELVVITAGTHATLWIHELGHHFNLHHTFGEDLVADTKSDPESTCTVAFGCTNGGNLECCCPTKLANLAAEGHSPTDYHNLLYNIMSYYGAQDCIGLIQPPHDWPTILFTDGQLDRWSDATRFYAQLQGEVTGFTYFVDKSWGGASNGYSTGPYKTIATGLASAAAVPGNILLVRSGAYAENLTLSAPVTLRASKGAVTIGQ